VRTDRLRKELGVEYKWTVFPLHPDLPEQGVELADMFKGRDIDIAAVQKRLLTVAAKEGLPFGTHTRSYNTRKAQELGKLAEKLGVIEPYQQAVYRAFFVDGRNISMTSELLEIGKSLGIPEDNARETLEQRTFSKAVDDDWERVRQVGISGVPAFICNNRLVEGFQPYEHLVEFVQAAR
jgi:predicted DsbA family dithiol-disulfide isomerase